MNFFPQTLGKHRVYTRRCKGNIKSIKIELIVNPKGGPGFNMVQTFLKSSANEKGVIDVIARFMTP